MRFRTTLTLLVIALLAAAVFFLWEQPRHRHEADRQELADDLTEFGADDVFALEIRRPDIELHFQRSGERWRLTSPLEDFADDGRINTLVQSITRAEIERTIRQARDELAEYGLDSPCAVVRLRGESGDFTLSVGDHNVTKSHCYALRDGGEVEDEVNVLLIPAGIRRYALLEPFEFRDKKVYDFVASSVSRLRIRSGEQTLDWYRPDSDSWISIVRDDTVRADASQIGALLSELRGLRAMRIVDDESERSRLMADTAGHVDLWLEPDSTHVGFSFARGESTQVCYVDAEGRNRAVAVDAAVLGIFGKTVHDLRDRFLLHFAVGEVTKFALVSPELTLSIAKNADKWSYANPEFGTVDDGAVTRLLHMLAKLKYKEIFSENAKALDRYGLATPRRTITLSGEDDSELDWMATGATIPDRAEEYVTSRKARLIGKIDTESIDAIVEQCRSLRIP